MSAMSECDIYYRFHAELVTAPKGKSALARHASDLSDA